MANDDPFLTALDARLEATKSVYTLEQFAEALHHLIVAALYDPKAKELLLEIARVGEGDPQAPVTEWLEAQRQRIRDTVLEARAAQDAREAQWAARLAAAPPQANGAA